MGVEVRKNYTKHDYKQPLRLIDWLSQNASYELPCLCVYTGSGAAHETVVSPMSGPKGNMKN